MTGPANAVATGRAALSWLPGAMRVTTISTGPAGAPWVTGTTEVGPILPPFGPRVSTVGTVENTESWAMGPSVPPLVTVGGLDNPRENGAFSGSHARSLRRGYRERPRCRGSESYT
ncbi:hypothetical protein GCM10027199_28870 [Amycolatopsis magusensis]